MHEVTQINKDGVVLLFYAMVPSYSHEHSMEFDEQFAKKGKRQHNQKGNRLPW